MEGSCYEHPTRSQVWDVSSGACVHTMAERQPANFMDLAAGMIIIASSNGTVNMWDLRSGQLIRALFSESVIHYGNIFVCVCQFILDCVS